MKRTLTAVSCGLHLRRVPEGDYSMKEMLSNISLEEKALLFDSFFLNEYETLIRLINGTECVISCNVRTVRMQMKRCQQLLDYLSRKKEEDSAHPLKLL